MSLFCRVSFSRYSLWFDTRVIGRRETLEVGSSRLGRTATLYGRPATEMCAILRVIREQYEYVGGRIQYDLQILFEGDR